ncbi:MAG: STAS domain-containing protein [Erysipelotrichaceae bacterium]|nr:STAS domain-containing protein [Erysipelotrichaceae bacterium]MDO5109233.1 STAS domain-containing protein [Erysipelotrichaceae bacterium]
MLNIKSTKENETLSLALEGRLDTTTAGQLDEQLKNDLDSSVKNLVFDFKNLEYISSAGLRVLLSAQKKMSGAGEMKVSHVNETIAEIFDITGFSDFLTID